MRLKDTKRTEKPVRLRAAALTIALLALTSWQPAHSGSVNWEKKLAKGYHELEIGNTESAIKIFSSKVKGHSQSGACHTALGRALKRKGKLDEAKAEFRQATQVEPTYADGFYELGTACEQDRQWDEAKAAFERYLQLSPDKAARQGIADRIRFCKNNKS